MCQGNILHLLHTYLIKLQEVRERQKEKWVKIRRRNKQTYNKEVVNLVKLIKEERKERERSKNEEREKTKKTGRGRR